MLVGQHGYVPEPYFLTETLRSQTRFHDPLQDSLFSNSTSVQGFRNWSTSSGVSTPKSPTSSPSPGSDESLSPTLLVRSCRPIGNLVATSAGHEAPTRQQCKKISDDLYEAHLPSLVTPKVLVPGNIVTRRIRYVILEVRGSFIVPVSVPHS
jgi:lysophospholipase